jgi:hypothetical protein
LARAGFDYIYQNEDKNRAFIVYEARADSGKSFRNGEVYTARGGRPGTSIEALVRAAINDSTARYSRATSSPFAASRRARVHSAQRSRRRSRPVEFRHFRDWLLVQARGVDFEVVHSAASD